MGTITLDRTPGKILVEERGSKLGNFDAVHIHGCDTTIKGRGRTKVHGVEAKWEERGELHLSDDRKSSQGGGLGLGL